MPKRLADKYAYAEIVGPQGPVHAERVILGLVLFAPNTTYPQHHHRGIEESYVSILDEPCPLAYAWVGPPERLAAPEMSFSPRRSQ